MSRIIRSPGWSPHDLIENWWFHKDMERVRDSEHYLPCLLLFEALCAVNVCQQEVHHQMQPLDFEPVEP
jgi:hypothetical protein